MLFSCTHMATVGFKGLNDSAVASIDTLSAQLTSEYTAVQHVIVFTLFGILLVRLKAKFTI